MNTPVEFMDEDFKKRAGVKGKALYIGLFRKFILLTLICSLLPLLIVGWGINIHYTNFAKSRMVNAFQLMVDYHRKIIEQFLSERTSKLRLIANTHTKDDLKEAFNLNHIFKMINRDHGAIVDLGIIDETGRHLAYIGPYDLMSRNYSQTLWFKEVMEKDIYISDMFMGFRSEPHFIIAVTRAEKGKKWILRATIDTDAFRSFVENVRIGKTGEVFLLNTKGEYQTSPRFSGRIMEKAPFHTGPIYEGTEIKFFNESPDGLKQSFPKQIVAQTWLKNPRWVLTVKQDYAEAFSDVNHANYATLIFLHLSAISILIVAVMIARYMISVIKKQDIESDQLNKQLMQAGKLASIGELSSGVAHEINNPLAIILTERQILLDLSDKTRIQDTEFKNQLTESMDQIDTQIHRCKHITQSLLRFSRRTRSVVEDVDLNSFIKEVIGLMEREARTGGIKFLSDLEDHLPSILSDPSQLQQVFLNLITNAIDAHDGKSYGSIRITTRFDEKNKGVKIVFADTGTGISEKGLEKIFDPFFTTKPVGKGTGLGLSISHSIINQLGGNIDVRSEVGVGTEFSLFLPLKPPPDLKEDMADD